MPGVGRADLGGADAADVAALLCLGHILLRAKKPGLIAGELVEHGFGLPSLFVHIQLPDDPLHHRKAVGAVVDGETLPEAQQIRVPAQYPGTGAVECHGPDALGLAAQPPFQTLFQLPGGLVGKGDGQYLPGPHPVHGAQIPDIPVHGYVSLGGLVDEGGIPLGDVPGDLRAVGGPAIAQEVFLSLIHI